MGMLHCALKITSCCLGVTASLAEPEKKKKWDNCQVLGELAVSFVAHSLCNGKTQGLSQVLAGVACEVTISGSHLEIVQSSL